MFLKVEPYIRKQWTIAFLLNLGHILTGFFSSWSSPCVYKLQNEEESPLGYAMSDTEASWLVSLSFIGGTVSISIGFIGDLVGRKNTLLLGGILMTLGVGVATWPVNASMIYCGRALMGYAICFISIINMVYIGEIASSNIRGFILTSTGAIHGFAILIMYSVGGYLSYRNVGLIFFVFCILYVIGTLFIPESPMYYVIKGKYDEARKVLEKLGRTENIETELKSMIKFANEDKNFKVKDKIKDIFVTKSNRKAFIISTVLFLVQNCNGSIIVLLFAMTIFEKAGTGMDSKQAMIIVGLLSFLGSLVAPICVDKYGRRLLLLISTGCCFLAMLSLGVYFYLAHLGHPSVEDIGWVPLASFILSLFSFSAGMSVVPNTLTGEMYRPAVRSTGTSLSMTIGWLMGFFSASCFSYVAMVIGNHFCFFFFAIVNLFGMGFTFFYVPETKGKSLEEIEQMLAK